MLPETKDRARSWNARCLSYDSSIYLVKLKSGYNIGIPKENVLSFEVLKKYPN